MTFLPRIKKILLIMVSCELPPICRSGCNIFWYNKTVKKFKNPFKGETGWCFAIVNGRLGEIFFDVGGGVKGIHGHCYINRDEYNIKERKEIDADIKKHILIYRNKKYSEKLK